MCEPLGTAHACQSEDSLWGVAVSTGSREPLSTLVAVRTQLWVDSLHLPLRESQGRNLVCQACVASTLPGATVPVALPLLEKVSVDSNQYPILKTCFSLF